MDDNELHLMVGEIRADVKALLSKAGDHETRLRSLEKWRWITHAGSVSVAFVAAKLGVPFIPASLG